MSFLIKGSYTDAICMLPYKNEEEALASGSFEQECYEQVKTLCSMKKFENSSVRIMPDCHAGKGCVVGFTAKINDFAIPNVIGVDINCSVSIYKLDAKEINCEKLDEIIRKYVPSGLSVRNKISELVSQDLKDKIYKVCEDIDDINSYKRHLLSIGSLGGGNHYLAIECDSQGNNWLCVHCGSRNFGKKICEYHQNKAIQYCKNKVDEARKFDLSQIPAQDRQQWIKDHKIEYIPESLSYIENEDLDLYVEHMKVAEEFATVNHQVIVHEICSHMGWNVVDSIFTHHNYIEFLGNREMIIRKGAISAKKGERVIIPLNMKDGSIVGIGKGNEEWNQSAPHGAGRVLSRGKAKSVLSVEEFQDKMKDVWSSCVSESTLDESPMAYKDMNVIIDAIGETVDIVDRIIPIYNFKAQG